ncbi:hypothetical protein JF634_09825 [Simonsiella muelleri]|uniref:Surface-adhesin protein E-like domain-containing protein n=1 Tax=Simonsiella muelleri ATCC 29453 TaxID=641147 RepID=V9HLH8_9NEIS|nr:hypothetical protein [Simonsiella muelleri]AUX61407.1 hypothetical protein BWP33_06025 [Simonsiella muelleri ATCC 29453]EFG31075.1 hypothetical protein HMPREF9021_00903 [Simonsiella muelleri ATCC 29453]UBQ53460.1 hypothetical protein JF634_09825 [Simonsiella muelleri]
MKIRLCLIMACLLLVGCQAQRAKIASLWSSEEVVEDVADAPYSDVSYGDDANMNNATYTTSTSTNTPNFSVILNDTNKLLTLTDVSGNREYLVLDSIAQERGVVTALIEFRYVKPQTLPANGMIYHYNQWREQIDCKNKVRILRTTTHYNAVGEVVDTRDYPLPKYKPAELAALSQPDDKVIQQVCERVGEKGLAVGDATLVTDTNKPVKEKPVKEKATKAEENRIKVDEKIDFINKGKTETAPIQAASDVVKPAEKATESTEKSNKKDKKADKKSSKKSEKSNDKPAEQSTPAESPALEEGEIPLTPI